MTKAYVHNKGKLLSYHLTLVYLACTWTFVDSFKHLSQTVTHKTDSLFLLVITLNPQPHPLHLALAKGEGAVLFELLS